MAEPHHHHHQNLQRIAQASRSNHLNHHPFEPAAPMIHPQPPPMATNSNLLFSPSESPQVQHKNILQRLSQEIEKSGAHKVRYVDSELYLRNQEPRRSPLAQQPPEVQTTTLNIGGSGGSNNSRQSSSGATNNRISTVNLTGDDQITAAGANSNNHQRPPESTSGAGGNLIKPNGNCQVCLIREVRQDLMNINKMVQERNEQIVKLKDKFKDRCLRSYFERQTSPK